ncbi:MAG: hypothetical protein ACKVKF_24535, partial [Rhodobacterales bacterium]
MDAHQLTAGLALVLALFAARAYIPNLLAEMTPPASSLAWGFFFFSLGAIGRSTYWSFGRVLPGDAWPEIRDHLGGLNANIG